MHRGVDAGEYEGPFDPKLTNMGIPAVLCTRNPSKPRPTKRSVPTPTPPFPGGIAAPTTFAENLGHRNIDLSSGGVWRFLQRARTLLYFR